MKKIFFILILIGIGYGFYYLYHPLGPKIRIQNHTFSIEVAVTEAQKELGLGKREKLDANTGMLFPYDHKEQYNFWMKDMHFPLDFIWIDGKTVVDITKNVPPPTGTEQPVVITPKVPVDKIFEVNAGTIAKYGIQIGDTVEFIDK
jgi:uncharacterized protein